MSQRPHVPFLVVTTVAAAAVGALAGPAALGQGANPVDEFIDALNTPEGQEWSSQFLRGAEPGSTTKTDPAGDFEHSTGQPPGYTPEHIDIMQVEWFELQLNGTEDAGGLFGTFQCDRPVLETDAVFPVCPDPPLTPGGPPGTDPLFGVRFELGGPPPPFPPGRCEFVFWGRDPGLGPTFSANPSFPNDPADDTNVAWGLGFNPPSDGVPGDASVFKLVHPGSGGFEPMPTDAVAIVDTEMVVLAIPRYEMGVTDLGTFYTFCVEEGYDFSPQTSGADQVPKVAIDLDDLPVYGATLAAPAPSPEPTEPAVPATTPPAEPTPSDSESVVAAPAGEQKGGRSPLGPIAIGTGAALIVGGAVLRRRTRTGPPAVAVAEDDPCARIARAYAKAREDAEAKRREADRAETEAETAEKKASDARDAETRAETELDDAEKDRKKAERDRDRPPPGEEDAWIEDAETGERITGRDLRLRREAAQEAWDDYRDNPSEESAEQTEQDWKDLDADGARDARRAADDADQARRQADLDKAEAAKAKAEQAEQRAERARKEAERDAREKRDAADRADQAADAAEARAAELKRRLDECLGLKGGRGGATTPWGPVGIGHDDQTGCYPEGNVEEVVLDTFDRTVRLDVWVTAPEDSTGHHEAHRLAGEMRYWRDIFGLTSSAINVAGAVKGLASRTVRDGVDTALSGGSVIAGEQTGLDIPTVLPQVPVVVLEGLAATAGTIFDAWGRWIEHNHVTRTLMLGDVHRHVHLEWVEVRRCEGGRVRCVERYVRIQLGPEQMSGAMHSEDIVPRENWRRRAQGLARTMARKIQTDAEAVREFMAKYDGHPCE